jgi:hypothetical protein
MLNDTLIKNTYMVPRHTITFQKFKEMVKTQANNNNKYLDRLAHVR